MPELTHNVAPSNVGTLLPNMSDPALAKRPAAKRQDYKGFVAGVFSGIAKLSVGHPFDTIKVRLQTADRARFPSTWVCITETVKKEGFAGFYKGATPPLVGWMFMDSLMLGSLTLYRRMLNENIFNREAFRSIDTDSGALQPKLPPLPTIGHAVAGVLAGWSVSLIAAPVEHVKARLQIQYAAKKSDRLYHGPIDCTRKMLAHSGLRGLYHGLSATILFRTSFFFWWGSYDLFTKALHKHTQLSTPAVNFWAGGLSAQVFWLFTYPTDVVKQRIMTDPLNARKYPRWKDAARAVYVEGGLRGYWRGFLPCFVRAFPANAAALLAFESVMRFLE